MPTTQQIGTCQVLIFSKAVRDTAQSAILQNTGRPFLTIGLYREFIQDGGIVVLPESNQTHPPHYNRTAMIAHGLKLGARHTGTIIPLDFAENNPTDPDSIKRRLDAAPRPKRKSPNQPESQITAAMIGHVLAATKWPGKGDPKSTKSLRFGFVGSEKWLADFMKVLNKNRQISYYIEWIPDPSPDEAATCRAIYLSAPGRGKGPDILARLSGQPEITISRDTCFLEEGGLLEIRPHSKKLRGSYNPDALRASGLEINKSLLKILTAIRSGESEAESSGYKKVPARQAPRR